MCTGSTMMMAMSTAVNVAGQLQQGKAQKAAYEAQARQEELRAAQERDAAQAEADRIRKAGMKQQSMARAMMAASGIRVDQGSGLLIDEEIGEESEKDAFNTLLTGKRRSDSLKYSAAMNQSRGKSALAAARTGAATSVLQGWKGVKPAATEGYRYTVPTYDGAEY